MNFFEILEWTLIGIAALTFIIVLIYAIFIPGFYNKVLESTLVKTNETAIEADQAYFLPAGTLVVSATVKIAVTTRVADSTLVSADIYELSLETSVQLVADQERLYKLDYHGTWLASDDIKLGTNAAGMLENLSITSEDRVSAVISELTDAPKKLITPDKSPAFQKAQADQTPITVTNIGPFTKSFTLYPGDLQKATYNNVWQISIPGQSASSPLLVDASFQLGLTKPLVAPATGLSNGPFGGLITRPLTRLPIDVYLNVSGSSSSAGGRAYNTQPATHFEVMVPDTERTLSIAVTRSPFVKKVQSPKFSSGLLIENDITKPSELESMLNIPINIGKAIFSIPAQLLTLKIQRIQQEASLDTETQKLLTAQQTLSKAQQDAQKSSLDAQKTSLGLTQDLINAQQSWTAAKKDLQDLLQKIEAAKLQK